MTFLLADKVTLRYYHQHFFVLENQFTISLRSRPLLKQYVTTMSFIFPNETILKCLIIAICTPPIHPICLHFGKIYLNYTSLRLLRLQLLLNTLYANYLPILWNNVYGLPSVLQSTCIFSYVYLYRGCFNKSRYSERWKL